MADVHQHRRKSHRSFITGGLLLLLLLTGSIFWLVDSSPPSLPTPRELDWDLMCYRNGDEGQFTYYNFAAARHDQSNILRPGHLDFSELAQIQFDDQTIEAIFQHEIPTTIPHVILALRFNQPIHLPTLITSEVTLVEQNTPTIYQHETITGRFLVVQVDPTTVVIDKTRRVVTDEIPVDPTILKRVLKRAATHSSLPEPLETAFRNASGYYQIEVLYTPNTPKHFDEVVSFRAHRTLANGDLEQYDQHTFFRAEAATKFHKARKEEQPPHGAKINYWLTETITHQRLLLQAPK